MRLPKLLQCMKRFGNQPVRWHDKEYEKDLTLSSVLPAGESKAQVANLVDLTDDHPTSGQSTEKEFAVLCIG